MNRTFTLLLAIAFVFVGFKLEKAHASHAMGADISYECASTGTYGRTYNITLRVYRDCAGVGAPASATVRYVGGSYSMSSLSMTRSSGPTEVSQLCPSSLSSSRCRGGSLPGTEVVVFTGTVTLPGTATDWTFSYSLCCRNAAISNLTTPSSRSLYIEAKLDNQTFTCNNSPVFSNLPVPYICRNQKASYNHGTTEADGDSLNFYIIQSKNSATVNIPYVVGLDTDTPLFISDTFQIDARTGQMCFTPDRNQQSVIALQVDEYRSGVWIGSTIREVQIVVQACSNSNPSLTHPFRVQGCPGDSVIFNVVGVDTDFGDTLTLTSNNTSATPGSAFTTSGTNPITGTYKWLPGVADTGRYIISFTLKDDACPIPGQNIYSVELNIINGTVASPDTLYYCGDGIPVEIKVDGGKSFTWRVISGPSMSVPGNFSCDTCRVVYASPPSTTVYEVTSDLAGVCGNKDTVVVKNEYEFGISPDTLVCPGDSAWLRASGLGDLITPGDVCGLPMGYACGGTSSVTTIGSRVTTASLTSPFMGFSRDVKYQMLFRASELTGMGAGVITAIGIDGGGGLSSIPYRKFTVSVGCTPQTYLTLAGGFESGLTPVWGPQSFTYGSGGWKTFNFNQSFPWDGSTNLIFELCFNNTSSSFYDNVWTTRTPFTSVLMHRSSSSSGDGCAFTTPSYVGNDRTRVRFTKCPFPTVTDFIYEWTPGTGLSDSTSATPTMMPTGTHTYVVTIKGGHCPYTDTVTVGVDVCLPIELLEFDAYKQGEDVLLDWTTLTETNSQEFVIERSVDGVNFSRIGAVSAAGFSKSQLSYTFLDENPFIGNNFYRLKMVDLDGTFEYSELRKVSFNGANNIKVYPNPVNKGNSFFVDLRDFQTTDENIEIKLFNVIGELVDIKTVKTENLSKPIEIAASKSLSQAVYFISIETSETSFQSKLTID